MYFLAPVSPALPRSDSLEIRNDDNPVEAPSEISFNHHTTTILSTASIPLKRIVHRPYSLKATRTSTKLSRVPDHNDEREGSQSTVRILIPRRRQEPRQQGHRPTTDTARPILRSSDREKRTTNELSTVSKRSCHGLDSSQSKKRLQIVEVTLSD